MQWLRQRLTSVLLFLRGTGNPTGFFKAQRPHLWLIVETIGAYLLLLGILVGASSLIGASLHPDSKVSPTIREQLNLLHFRDPGFPRDMILFLLTWVLFLLVATLVRRSFAAFLGDSERALSTYALITCVGILPLLTIATILRIGGNILPFDLIRENNTLIYVRFGVSGGLLFLGWLWDAWICVKGLRVRTTKVRGRAILTWIVPYVFWIVIFSFLSGSAG